MPQSELRLIKRWDEFVPKENVVLVPPRLRGIYVLYKQRRKGGCEKYDVLYVGMASSGRRRGIHGRLRTHLKKKRDLWTHFSLFEVWDNIRDEEVAELEGLFRHLYRQDTKANSLNVQRGLKKLARVREDIRGWKQAAQAKPSPHQRRRQLQAARKH